MGPWRRDHPAIVPSAAERDASRALIRPPGRSARELTLRKIRFRRRPRPRRHARRVRPGRGRPDQHGQGRDHRRAPTRPSTVETPNELYAEAIQHTPNVIQVYSPNATWSAVKAATAGANVVIYLGHGNGWPSPYTYDPTLHDEGRLRAQRNGRRQRRLQPQVLRRAVDPDPRPRPERDRVPAPPLLRLGQLRAASQTPRR